MKRKPGFDDEFRPKGQRWIGRLRSIGWMIIVVAVCGVVIAVIGGDTIRKNPIGCKPTRFQFPQCLRVLDDGPQ